MVSLDSLFAPAVFLSAEEPGLIRAFLGEKVGVFVEVGAHDPVRGSQTWSLEQEGWTGLLVEPRAEMAAELRASRRAIVEEVACGGPETEGTRGLLHVRGAHSTLDAELGDAGVIFTEKRYVPMRTLDSLLADAGIERVDFLSVDVEGCEEDVLRGTDLMKLRPRLILIEDKARALGVHRHMTGCGYKRVRRTGLNSWYVPRDDTFPVSLSGRLQLTRKYVLALPFHRLQDRLRRSRRPVAGVR